MTTQRDIASFLVRFTQERWSDPQHGPQVRWRGYICHVQDGLESRFTDMVDAVLFIQHTLLKLTLRATASEDSAHQEKLLQESLQRWEELATHYRDALTAVIHQLMGTPAPPDTPKAEEMGPPDATPRKVPPPLHREAGHVHERHHPARHPAPPPLPPASHPTRNLSTLPHDDPDSHVARLQAELCALQARVRLLEENLAHQAAKRTAGPDSGPE